MGQQILVHSLDPDILAQNFIVMVWYPKYPTDTLTLQIPDHNNRPKVYPDQLPIIMIEELSVESDHSPIPPPVFPPGPFLMGADREHTPKRPKILPFNQGMREDFSEDKSITTFQLDPIEIDKAVDAAISSLSVPTLKTLPWSSNLPLVNILEVDKSKVVWEIEIASQLIDRQSQ